MKAKTPAPRASKTQVLNDEETWLAALGARLLNDFEEEGATLLAEFEPGALARKLRRRLSEAQRARLDHVAEHLHEWRSIPFDDEDPTPWDPEEPWTGPSYDPAPTRRTLERAIQTRADVEMDYFTHGRGENTTRRVTPHDIDGRYFTGYCHLRKEDRTFRIERVARLRLVKAKSRTR